MLIKPFMVISKKKPRSFERNAKPESCHWRNVGKLAFCEARRSADKNETRASQQAERKKGANRMEQTFKSTDMKKINKVNFIKNEEEL